MVAKKALGLIVLLAIIFPVNILAKSQIKIPMYLVAKHGFGKSIGFISAEDTASGLLLKTNLSGLSHGFHALHVHENANCNNFAHAAGPHYDPKITGSHRGPYSVAGHLGDLPVLFFNQDKVSKQKLLAPHVSVKDIINRSLIIHAEGDNYTDNPVNCGSGERVACGIVKSNAAK